MATKGFIYVASVDFMFYKMACMSALSLRDCYPDADITLFTHKEFVDDKSSVFNNIITNIPFHKRAKMWCASNTPYEKTAYLDADTLVVDAEIKDIFDYIENHDLAFQKLNIGVAGKPSWEYGDKDQTQRFELHGGIYCFNKTSSTLDFFKTWFDEYHKQINFWGEEHEHLNPDCKKWDMLTLWRLRYEDKFFQYKKISLNYLPNKYNYTPWENIIESPVIMHYPKYVLPEDYLKNEKFTIRESTHSTDPIRYK